MLRELVRHEPTEAGRPQMLAAGGIYPANTAPVFADSLVLVCLAYGRHFHFACLFRHYSGLICIAQA